MFETIFPYLLIIATVFVFYIRTIRYSIIVDDIQHYSKIKKGHYSFHKEQYEKLNFIGKIKYFIRLIKVRLYGGGTFGLNTIHDHLFTTALHAITCCLIFILFGQGTFALATTLLYAVNPINNQTAIWLNGRRYQIAVILCLLALIVKPIGGLFYLISLAFQGIGFFLPVFLLDNANWYLIFLLIPIIIFMLPRIQAVYFSRMNRIFNQDQKKWGIGRIIVIIKSYGFYFFNMIFPTITMMNYPTLIQWGVTKRGNKDAYAINLDLVKGIAAFLATALLISIPKLRLIGLFIFLGTLQWSAVICAFQQLADRYMSLVNVFMMYCVVYFASQTPYTGIIIFSFFVYYATQLNISMQMYKTIDRFFEYQMFWRPELARNRVIYADSFMAIKDITRAWMVVEAGLRYDPTDFELSFRAAQCSAAIGMLDKADHFIKRCEENFYIGQEEIQRRRIENLRNQMRIIQENINNHAVEEKRKMKKSR